jgi:hypothetical protein
VDVHTFSTNWRFRASFFPMFLYLSPRVTKLGQFLLLLPLFLPPFLNTNAIWAYVLTIVFAMAYRLPKLERYLFIFLKQSAT